MTFNGTAITGANIGLSSDNCWGFLNSQAYQADVTSLVPGDGVYTLANFVKPGGIDVNGVSLLVFFDDGDATNNRDIVVFLGNDSNQPNTFDPAGWNAVLDGINYSSGTVTLRLIVADGQTFSDGGFAINATQFLAPGQNWDGNTLPNDPAQGLWDHSAYDITATLAPGINNLTLTDTGSSNDCLSLISTIFDLPAGAAPPPPQTIFGIPTLSEWGITLLALLLGGLGAFQLRLRRR